MMITNFEKKENLKMKALKIASKVIIIGLIAISIYWLFLALFGSLLGINPVYFAFIGIFGLFIPGLTVAMIDTSIVIIIVSVLFAILNLLMFIALEDWTSMGYKTFILILWVLLLAVTIGSLGPVKTLLFLVPAIYVLLMITQKGKEIDQKLEEEFGVNRENKKGQIVKKDNGIIKVLKVISIITIVLQIVFLPFYWIAKSSTFIMASPMLIGIMLIIIIIHCLVLGALMNKGTELFKKVVMITYLVYGIFIVVYSILQLGDDVLSTLFDSLKYFAIFVLPSVIYLYLKLYKNNSENEEKHKSINVAEQKENINNNEHNETITVDTNKLNENGFEYDDDDD